MYGFLLMVPFFLVRFGLLRLLSEEAFRRAALFAPMREKERIAYWVYQLSTVVLLIYMCFLKIDLTPPWGHAGLLIYPLGIVLCAVAIVNFAKPKKSGINMTGLYRISRNPMYVAYFVFFLGCVLLTRSPILLITLVIFQVSAHWVILAEERWCVAQFQDEYVQYMKKVRRYV